MSTAAPARPVALRTLAVHVVLAGASAATILTGGIGYAWVVCVVLFALVGLGVAVGAGAALVRRVRAVGAGLLLGTTLGALLDVVVVVATIVLWFSLHPGAEFS